jgi:YHS domain-containing protein
MINPYGTRPQGPADSERQSGAFAPTQLNGPQTPPHALNGHCPVTLCTQQRWQPGDPRWGAIHRGRTYLFSSPAQQRQFLADPDLYSPVLSGVDAVRLADENQLVEGKRQHGVIYRNQIYLFDSEQSLATFSAAPERYAAPIRQAMATGNFNQLLR